MGLRWAGALGTQGCGVPGQGRSQGQEACGLQSCTLHSSLPHAGVSWPFTLRNTVLGVLEGFGAGQDLWARLGRLPIDGVIRMGTPAVEVAQRWASRYGG